MKYTVCMFIKTDSSVSLSFPLQRMQEKFSGENDLCLTFFKWFNGDSSTQNAK